MVNVYCGIRCCNHTPKDKGWGRGNRLVMYINWNDITQNFIPWLNQTTFQTFKLLSEAEWEYAARAGSNTKYSWGTGIGNNNANCNDCGSQRNGKQTYPARGFSANAFGLYDMHDNVWEWVQDCWNDSYNGAPSHEEPWKLRESRTSWWLLELGT